MSDKKKKQKKKKEKITYIDDGRTIADMSGTTKGGAILPGNTGKSKSGRSNSTFKDVWKTYWGAVKMMLVPMLVTLGIISVAFLLMYLFMK